MSQKTYTLFVDGEPAVDYGSKKTAVKYGDLSGKTYQVHSPTGAVVHAVQKDAPAPEPKSAAKFEPNAMKAKIAKLLAKAERTDNDEERDAFNRKAEQLMIQLGIGFAELEAAGEIKPEEIIEVRREWHGNYSIVMLPFVYDLAKGFGNLTILQSNYGAPMLRTSFIIGHKSDVEQFCELLDSLALQVMSALRRWQKENAESRRGLTDMVKYVQNRSFISGFGAQVRDRLYDLRTTEEETASTGAALVLASKQERVDGWIEDSYGKLGNGRGGVQQHSSLARNAGRVAGKTANLGEKAVGGTRKEIK